jgi:hypothetical protein
VYSERSDIAAGKKERLYYEGIRGDGHARTANLDDRLIVHPIEDWIREERQENVAQQLGAEPSTAAVTEQN